MAAQGKIGRRSPLAKATGDESTRIGTDGQKQIPSRCSELALSEIEGASSSLLSG